MGVGAVVPYSVVSRTDRARDVSLVRERRDHHKTAITGPDRPAIL